MNVWLVITIALAGSDVLQSELVEAERASQRLVERIEAVEQRVLSNEAQATKVMGVYQRATERNVEAIDAFADSKHRFRKATVIAWSAAALSAGKLVCQGRVSPRAYRAEMGAGRRSDVDHWVPRKYGGVDNQLNYRIIPRSQNRAMGADVSSKLADPRFYAGVLASAVDPVCPR